MLLLRWTFLDDPRSFYDLEDDPREEYDDDWLSFYDPEYFIDVLYPDEDIKEEYEDEWLYRLEDDSTELIEEFTEVILPDFEEVKEEYEDDWTYKSYDEVFDTDQVLIVETHDEDYGEEVDWFDSYGVVDLPPPPPPDVSEQIWIVFLDDDPREEYDEEFVDRGVVDNPSTIISQVIVIVGQGEDVEEDFFEALPDAILEAFISSGRQISEKEVEEVEAEQEAYLRKQDYPEVLRFKDSKNIETVLYDKNTGEMQIRFKSGGTYRYEDVPPSKFKGLGKAKSSGTYFHNKIKPSYPGKKL